MVRKIDGKEIDLKEIKDKEKVYYKNISKPLLQNNTALKTIIYGNYMNFVRVKTSKKF